MEPTICPIDCVRSACPEPDFLEKHSTFVLTAIGSFSALLGIVFTYCLKSRCSNIRTPCISCDRVPIDITDVKNSIVEIKENENSINP